MSQGHNGSSWLADLMSNRPFIVGALFLGTYFAPFLILIGFPLALIFQKRPEEEWEQSHFTYLIWTIIYAAMVAAFGVMAGVAVFLVMGEGGNTTFVLAVLAFLLGGLILAYCGVRVLISLMKSASRVPMIKPKTWWI
ncbi:MAG: hypothetical protein AAGB23_02790 [Pseudomonadota bacterium]